MKENDTDANDPGKSPDPKAWWVQSKEEMGRHSTALWTTFAPIYPLDSHQSVRLQLVLELIRAGRIDDCLSLAHEAEMFVLNGMENKPMDGPAESNSSWPQTNDEVISDGAGWIMRDAAEAWKQKWEDTIRVARESLAGDDPEKNRTFDSLIQSEMFVQGGTVKFVPNAKGNPDSSIQAVFNEKWNVRETDIVVGEIEMGEDGNPRFVPKQDGRLLVNNEYMPNNGEAPITPPQEKVNVGGESPLDPDNMSLWEICEAIIETVLPLEAIVVGNWKLSRSAFSMFELFTIDGYRHMLGLDYFSIQKGSEVGREMIMEQLMQFPPFKK